MDGAGMGEINSSYYKGKGARIYSDFKTYAHSGKLLAGANAKEFCEKFANSKETVLVAEFGVGNGKFACDFLVEVEKKDSALYAKTRYMLFDFSSKMLASARKTLGMRAEKCEFIAFDAAKEKLPKRFAGKINYARMNELLTDLPCEFYALQNKEVVEAEFGRHGEFSGFLGADAQETGLENAQGSGAGSGHGGSGGFADVAGGSGFENGGQEGGFLGAGVADNAGDRNIIAGEFLSRIGENYIIPFNFVACEFVCELGGALAQGGIIDIFDYGFSNAADVQGVPAQMWNMNIVREFGGQLTTDLNVPLLCAFAKSHGLKVEVQGQKQYVENTLGKKGSIGETRYEKSAKGIGESDMFFHVRILA